jgi:hypothetical protein
MKKIPNKVLVGFWNGALIAREAERKMREVTSDIRVGPSMR